MSKENNELVVSLDIGTSKVAAIVAEVVSPSGALQVIGVGHAESNGMDRGEVTDIAAMTHSIEGAVAKAENMANCDIHDVVVGISGAHISSVKSHGMAVVGGDDKGYGQIRREDMERAVQIAGSIALPANRRLLHVIPEFFQIDSDNRVKRPIGMVGRRLEASAHLVLCGAAEAQNIERCLENCDLRAERYVLEQLASSSAVLTDDERDIGVCLLDIGGGTTDIAIFTDGCVRHTSVVPIAGDHVTNDLAYGLHTSRRQAEQIKRKYGAALLELIQDDEVIEVPSVAPRKPRSMARQTLVEVVRCRYQELFELVKTELQDFQGKNQWPAGMVLTGGSSVIPGVTELAAEIFGVPTRLGEVRDVSGLKETVSHPMYATGVGLLRYDLDRNAGNNADHIGYIAPPAAQPGVFGRWSQGLRRHFTSLFMTPATVSDDRRINPY